jgi:hypothetical protein
MSAHQPRLAVGPPVVRRFESTRLQAQSIAVAYQALIPSVSRPLGLPRVRSLAATQMDPSRSRARGG